MVVFDSDVLKARQQRVAQMFDNNAPIVLFGAGEPIGKPGGHDQVYGFIPHPRYYWLTGLRRAGGVLAFDAQSGWTHFVCHVTDAERLWEGTVGDVVGEDVANLDAWLQKRKGRTVVSVGANIEGVDGNGDLALEMALRVDRVRRRLDAAELAVFEKAVLATAAGHKKACEVIGQGITERQVQIELEAEMMRYGAHEMGYGTIVGAGGHAAVLHFEPSDRVIDYDDLVLIDAGGALFGYTADVTRTYPAGDVFTPQQQAIYEIVLNAELAAIDHCQVGVEWHDIHTTAARVIAQGLRDLGILKGEVDTLLESGAVALFFPHGVGHMVGLGVRGVGGCAPGRDGTEMYCGARIRVDLPLETDFLMTVEPGIYFVPALLDDGENREKFRDMVAWDQLDAWRSVGGVRIEDNVLITPNEPVVLTKDIPK